VLPLLKDKVLYLTVTNEKSAWLRQIKSKDYQFGEFATNELKKQILQHYHKSKSFQSIDVVFESRLCRFIVLPALKIWPEKEAFDFLIQQRFKHKYPDYHANNFIILHDQLKFDRPCVVVAFPKIMFKQIDDLQPAIKIKSLMPSILSIWNYYEKKLNNSILMIEESSLVYLIQYEKGIIRDIDVFPQHLKQAFNHDNYFNLVNKSLVKVEKNSLVFDFPDYLKTQNDQSYVQALNFLRLSSHG